MKRRKLIVEHDASIDAVNAMAAALAVVRNGYVSTAADIPHFCWLTQMKSGLQVSARRKKTRASADVLVVHGPYESVDQPAD